MEPVSGENWSRGAASGGTFLSFEGALSSSLDNALTPCESFPRMATVGSVFSRSNLPRLVAWFLLCGVAAWFVAAIPKTPLQYFDRANLHESYQQPYFLLQRKMERIALAHDTVHDPKHLKLERQSIIMGSYQASESTQRYLMENSEEYRALAEQSSEALCELFAAMKLARQQKREPVESKEERAQRRRRGYQELESMEMQRIQLMQSRLFW
jgi:hypothetical protein